MLATHPWTSAREMSDSPSPRLRLDVLAAGRRLVTDRVAERTGGVSAGSREVSEHGGEVWLLVAEAGEESLVDGFDGGVGGIR